MNALRHLPTLGVTAATTLFVAAAARYPGGTHVHTDTVGYSWAENFLCSLFAPQALNGAENAARPLAITALLLLCVSLGVVFFVISRSTSSRWHRSAIEIGGIGTAVYSMFVATPMHNLVISIGFVFGLVAFVAIGHLMWRERRRGLLLWSVVVLALKAASAVSYYGDVCYDWLPLLQKVGVVVGLGWLFGVHYRQHPEGKGVMKVWCLRVAVFLVAVAGAAATPVLSIVSWRLHWPAWIVWCSWPVAFAITALLLRRLFPLTKRPVPEDQSQPWREFHAVRRLELVGEDEENLSLVLDLMRERLDEPAVTMRFDGVSRIAVNHAGLWTFGFDGLVCEVLPKVADDGTRFVIRDPHGEAIAFRCRDFESVAP